MNKLMNLSNNNKNKIKSKNEKIKKKITNFIIKLNMNFVEIK